MYRVWAAWTLGLLSTTAGMAQNFTPPCRGDVWWADNAGSYFPLAGGLDEDGVMVLESGWIGFRNRQGQPVGRQYRWYWKPVDDNTIHNWGLRKTENDGEYSKFFDIMYRRNVPGGPTADFRETEPAN